MSDLNTPKSDSYSMTIGLEIHAELNTKSKMFCGCTNSPEAGAPPNMYVCPVCMGYPGTLPVVNKAAVKKVLSVGVAVGAKLADFSEFDRKNYFYPDIPKGYQISQYKYPLVSGGTLAGVELTRVHLEEDTARSTHDSVAESSHGKSGEKSNEKYSLVDYNRAGVPLMELVTEPVIHSAEQAINFAKELQLILQYLDVSDANMEKGQMRVEVNISVSKSETFGTKVEVKNINSFRAAGKAIEYEYARQVSLLEEGGSVKQETRGWDENKNATFSQRSKEDAHDYRYFPEPDIPKLVISQIPEFAEFAIKNELPELPAVVRDRYARDFGIKQEDIEVFVTDRVLGKFFETAVVSLETSEKVGDSVKILSNYITSDLMGIIKNSPESLEKVLQKITPKNIATLVVMITAGDVSSRGAKDILKIMSDVGVESASDPRIIAEEKGLIQKNDREELKKIMQEIVSAHPEIVSDYKNGKISVLQFFVGQGMKAMKGAGNPELLKGVVLEILK